MTSNLSRIFSLNKRINLITLFMLFFLYFSFNSINARTNAILSFDVAIFLLFLISLIVSVFFIFSRNINIVSVKKITALFSIMFVVFTSMLVNADYSASNYIFLMKVVSAFLFSYLITKNEFIESYIKSVFIICSLSLLAYIIYILVGPLLSNNFPVVYYGDDESKSYINMFISYVTITMGLPRNIAIFREPGVFQYFINIAIMFEFFFIKRKTKPIIITVFFITLITTFSSGGVPIGLGLLLLFFLNSNHSIALKFQMIILVMLTVILGTYIVKIEPDFNQRFEEMTTKVDSDKTSFDVRYESIFNTIKASTVKPLYGLGLTSGLIYIQDNYISYGTKDITGTMFIFLATLGYPLGLFLFYLLWKSTINLSKSNSILTNLALYLLIILTTASQNLIFDDFLWLLFFSSYMVLNSDNELSNEKV